MGQKFKAPSQMFPVFPGKIWEPAATPLGCQMLDIHPEFRDGRAAAKSPPVLSGQPGGDSVNPGVHHLFR